MQTLEVGPRKLVTLLREEEEGMKEGGNSFYSKQTNKLFCFKKPKKRERKKDQRECFWKSTKIHFG